MRLIVSLVLYYYQNIRYVTRLQIISIQLLTLISQTYEEPLLLKDSRVPGEIPATKE